MIRNCLNCDKKFVVDRSALQRSYKKSKHEGRFCSLSCAAKYRSKYYLKPEPNVECAYCGKLFYKNKSKQTKSKSGLFFCCREHKDSAQKIGGIAEIMPPHYGVANGKNTFRKEALKMLPNKCTNCNYDKYIEVLEVHHKDRNRKNNSITNLEFLCPTCHMEKHFLAKTGRWGSKNNHNKN